MILPYNLSKVYILSKRDDDHKHYTHHYGRFWIVQSSNQENTRVGLLFIYCGVEYDGKNGLCLGGIMGYLRRY